MSFTVVIPSRYGSSRLPGKPLVQIAGKPMVQRVYQQAKQSNAGRVVIATDDQRIVSAADGFAAEVMMTSPEHDSGTDRLQEVVTQLQLDDDHIVVNVQGDEPLIPPAVINQVANKLLQNPQAGIATLVEKITDIETVFNPNAVKVTMDTNGKALYFSRAPIPWSRDSFDGSNEQLPADVNYYRHIGIYAYRVSFLHQFVSWPSSSLEVTEKLEQLRALENGVTIMASEACEAIPAGIDTEQDLQAVRALFDQDGH
ncbi:MAG: 3-deoxy-manno-octulosonate cytidylyltransferase [Oceanicoccus sp.]|uniref:3-deoxy-manno-octulosonate cytidylyltransferase n=1 Tax=Oceanicoccus sp. TaxID=2691044 RepID=UPI00262E34C0|nr:3-deoxy-manno-octulosonate cytidylyltransferase [Oceanicoccus sp.]MCP3907679.1 3-deoxy-manno-octulosonate cytidylyltransferase [Oceanicoccus sp.]MDG1773712.1 3-deoxy-manno-octulosonate cytidylyltransferase [Oceanicoccus sp.]